MNKIFCFSRRNLYRANYVYVYDKDVDDVAEPFCILINELRHEKTGFLPMRKQRRRSAVQATAQLISAFVFATRIVQFHFYLYSRISSF